MKFNIVNTPNETSKKIKDQLLEMLVQHQLVKNDFEYLFIVGGDGFFLAEFQKVLHNDIKVIFINSGTLGFYAFSKDLDRLSIDDILNDKNYLSLDILKVDTNDETYYCVNDFAFHNNHTTHFTLDVNGVMVENFFGNGFLVSTNFGSTARNKSLGGPIVFPDVHAMIFNEVEAIQNKYNTSLDSSLVLHKNAYLDILVNNRTKNNGCFLCDGKEINNKKDKIHIKINMNESKAKVLISAHIEDYAKKLNYAFIEKDNHDGSN